MLNKTFGFALCLQKPSISILKLLQLALSHYVWFCRFWPHVNLCWAKILKKLIKWFFSYHLGWGFYSPSPPSPHLLMYEFMQQFTLPVVILQNKISKQWTTINFFFQIEKCQDVTLGYSTEKQCDKWPKTVCELNKVTRKRYTPETKCDKTRREVCMF